MQEEEISYFTSLEDFKKQISGYNKVDQRNKLLLYQSFLEYDWDNKEIQENTILNYIRNLLLARLELNSLYDPVKEFHIELIDIDPSYWLDETENVRISKNQYLIQLLRMYEPSDKRKADKRLRRKLLQIYELLRNPILYNSIILFCVDYYILTGEIHDRIYELLPTVSRTEIKDVFTEFRFEPLEEFDLTCTTLATNPYVIRSKLKDENEIPLTLVVNHPTQFMLQLAGKYMNTWTEIGNISMTCKEYQCLSDTYVKSTNPVPLTTKEEFNTFVNIKKYYHYKEIDQLYALRNYLDIYFTLVWDLQEIYTREKNLPQNKFIYNENPIWIKKIN